MKSKQPESWDRIRFRSNLEDYRPVKWPPLGPYWCSGEGDDYAIVVAYVPHGTSLPELLKFWPEMSGLDVMQSAVEMTFYDRFPKPQWWTDMEANRVKEGVLK